MHSRPWTSINKYINCTFFFQLHFEVSMSTQPSRGISFQCHSRTKPRLDLQRRRNDVTSTQTQLQNVTETRTHIKCIFRVEYNESSEYPSCRPWIVNIAFSHQPSVETTLRFLDVRMRDFRFFYLNADNAHKMRRTKCKMDRMGWVDSTKQKKI